MLFEGSSWSLEKLFLDRCGECKFVKRTDTFFLVITCILCIWICVLSFGVLSRCFHRLLTFASARRSRRGAQDEEESQ